MTELNTGSCSPGPEDLEFHLDGAHAGSTAKDMAHRSSDGRLIFFWLREVSLKTSVSDLVLNPPSICIFASLYSWVHAYLYLHRFSIVHVYVCIDILFTYTHDAI